MKWEPVEAFKCASTIENNYVDLKDDILPSVLCDVTITQALNTLN